MKKGKKNEKDVFWIKIRIGLYNSLLTVFIENSKSHLQEVLRKKTSGVGLSNIRERLELMYPGMYKLDDEDSLSFYSIKIELKL